MLPDLQTPADVSPGGALADQLGRPLRSLRVSVTDRCNLRCNYCMPQEEYVWLPRQELLTFEEIARLVEVFTSLGVEDVRLTGGEPLAAPRSSATGSNARGQSPAFATWRSRPTASCSPSKAKPCARRDCIA